MTGATRHRFVPLKPLVFQTLLALADGKRHGWSLIREVQAQPDGDRVLPGHFYRTLNRLRDDALIEHAPGDSNADPAERRQYFQLTALGRRVVRDEAERLRHLMLDPRLRKILGAS
jgi:DNA-binding PadR family transcriptional regulator